MRFAIFGTGGVGGYFGGRLAEAGFDVTFISRGDNLKQMQAHGLQISSPLGDVFLPEVHAIDEPAGAGTVDFVILGVKAWQVPEAALAIRPLLGTGTAVLPLQNGVEAVDHLKEAIDPLHVLGGVCRIIAYRTEPGVVRHVGHQPSITLGELNNESSPRVRALAAALESARTRVEIPEDIQSAIWQKFIFISAISGVGAVTRTPFGVLRSLAGSRRLYAEAIAEIIELAKARQIQLPENFQALMMKTLDTLPPDGTASMQRDIMEGRPSELESQNGAVVRLSQTAGVSTPVNRFLYDALLPQELRARGDA